MENLISFESFLSPAFIQLNDSYLNQRELFSNISSIMLKHGYVEKSYLNNVIEREKIYPTGLATPLLNIAIPHTDPIHIKKPFIFITKIEKPLSFGAMGTEDEKIDVNWIFSLGVTHAETQLTILQQLISLFSNENKVKTLISLNNEKDIYDFFINFK